MAFTDRPLPAGFDGVRQTVRAMSALVRMHERTPFLRQLLLAAHSRRADLPQTLINVLDWVVQNVEYQRDPPDVELVQSPRVTMARRAGDCDDLSVLIASMLATLGYRVRFVVGRVKGRKSYHHVWPEVRTPAGAWVAMDATLPHTRPGLVAPNLEQTYNFLLAG